MAKSKKRKAKTQTARPVKIKPENYIRKHARKLPFHECLIRADWKEVGLSPVIISRKRTNGNMVAGTYIVDLTCLGIKDTSFIYEIDAYSYAENIKHMGKEMKVNFIKIEPLLAQNIIYGAVEFAEDCGFEPHKDFTRVTEYLLDPVESIDYIEVHFGDENGKPSFFAGPYDDNEKIRTTLLKNVGEGNFTFTENMSPTIKYDYDSTNPIMSKQQIQETYLPNDKVNEKMANFELDTYKAAFIPQIICTGLILEEVEGELHLLQSAYEEKEDYLDNVLEKVANSYATSQGIAINQIEKDVLDELDNLVIFLTEKLIEFGSTDFLFEKTYTPIPRVKSEEELKEMSEEELDAHQAHRLFYMTNREKYYHTISEYAYYFLSVNHKETDFHNEKNQKEAVQQFLEDAKKESKETLSAEKLKDYEEACFAIMKLYFIEAKN